MLTEKNADGKISLSTTGNIITGCIAGGVSRFAVAPLDVVKIRYDQLDYCIGYVCISITEYCYRYRFQTQYHPLDQSHPPKYSTMMNTFKCIIKDEGIRGLWAYVLLHTIDFGGISYIFMYL